MNECYHTMLVDTNQCALQLIGVGIAGEEEISNGVV